MVSHSTVVVEELKLIRPCTGSHHVKAGWSFDKSPRFIQPPVMSRYRDRKLGRQCQFIGYDAYADATTRGQIRYGFDPGSSVVGNWDVMEGVLDYVFLKLGVDGANGGVDRPILMTEPVANMTYPRKCKCILICKPTSADKIQA
jgi:actin-related protein 5